jgi:aryl-alcohol dehydrogenase-like predicted oxidoreductase
MTLATQKLGSAGPDITRVGFGAWAIGGGDWAFGWGPQDDDAAIEAMKHAVSRGVNWIDTAAVYGLGHSEELVGRLLRELGSSDRPLVFTKCGLSWDDDNRMAPPRRNLTPAVIRSECEASLRRLGVDTIDLYQFHWPDETGTPVEDSWGEMARLAGEGKVRWVGVSNFSAELLGRCEPIRHVDSLQPPFSLIRRDFAQKTLPWCREHGTGVIVYSPMQSGLLTEKWTLDRIDALAKDDWRRQSGEFKRPNVERNLELRDALVPIAKKYGVSTGAIAVAWTLSHEGVTGAIVGARSPEQVDGWIGATDLRLTQEDLAEIRAALQRTNAGTGPV